MQTIRAVHSPVNMIVCVWQKALRTMNVIVHELDITEKTVKYVREYFFQHSV